MRVIQGTQTPPEVHPSLEDVWRKQHQSVTLLAVKEFIICRDFGSPCLGKATAERQESALLSPASTLLRAPACNVWCSQVVWGSFSSLVTISCGMKSSDERGTVELHPAPAWPEYSCPSLTSHLIHYAMLHMCMAPKTSVKSRVQSQLSFSAWVVSVCM